MHTISIKANYIYLSIYNVTNCLAICPILWYFSRQLAIFNQDLISIVRPVPPDPLSNQTSVENSPTVGPFPAKATRPARG